MIIERKVDPIQHLAGDGDRDRRRQPQDGPAAAHQVIAAFRPGDGVHHHGKGDADKGLRQRDHRPDEQHGLHGVIPRHDERHNAGQRIRQDDQEAHEAVPRHDLAAALQKAPDEEGEEQAGKGRHRRQQADLEIRRAQPSEKNRQERGGRARQPDADAVNLDGQEISFLHRRCVIGRR